MFKAICNLCGYEILANTERKVKDKIIQHLKEHHYQELLSKFRQSRYYRRGWCQNPKRQEKHKAEFENGFVCKRPGCGHDHFNWYAGIYGAYSIKKL